uniref:Large ribosomal subunit protein bL28m n=1 Tax=Arion vulgaris TaxID=1028688 RepID=A0A0B6ZHV8_9EUPU
MEKVKIKHFMPTIKQMKDMAVHEVVYFENHPNSRFTVASRQIPTYGTWINFWRSVPYLYKWSREEEKILPDHYKNRCREFMTRDPIPVHWRPDTRRYRVDEDTGERIPVVNAPLPVVYPEECNTGLWGGEGIIYGYYKKIDKKRAKRLATLPRLWRPYLMKHVLYSEILDRWMSVSVTKRAQFLIDESFGLDRYILETHEVDLYSQFGMKLKREMLLALARKSMYPDDPVKRDKVYNRYKEYVIPEEEAEWVGLNIEEAVEKAKKFEEETNKPVALKDVYLVHLVKKLQELSAGQS